MSCKGSTNKTKSRKGGGHQSTPTRPHRTTLDPVTLGSSHRRSSATKIQASRATIHNASGVVATSTRVADEAPKTKTLVCLPNAKRCEDRKA
eukprot:351583-Chlamydomonas_euryale.AAC.7